MKPELAQFIIQACENADTFFQFFQDEESMPTIREGYSGRGTYGKKASAIECQNPMTVMAAIACEIVERLGYSNDTDDEAVDLHEMLEDIRHFQMDSMGRDSVVIY
jgi:hypothetical protein